MQEVYPIMQSDTINFYLPDFYTNCNLICFIADLQKAAPDCFYPDVRIASAYGSFPNCIWNGGRVVLDYITKDKMKSVIEAYNSRGIAVRYTFTNPLIEEKHLGDSLCNMAMELADGGSNEILVNSPILEEYVREKYPKYPIISSTTKCLYDLESIKAEMEKDYYLVVLDSAMNYSEELFKLDHRDRMELIVDHFCQDNCPRRKTHYNILGKCQMEFSNPPADFTCKNIDREFFQIMENKSFISTEMIFGKFKDAGFRHFKLDGRSYLPHRLIASFLYYLVKPQWHDQMWQIILREVYKI